MKLIIFFLALFSLSLADKEFNLKKFQDISVALTQEDVEEFLAEVEKARATGTSAQVNEYADKIFANIQAFATKNNLDPFGLPDLSQKFLTAHVSLTNGSIAGIGSLVRSGDVEVVYNNEKGKKLQLVVPMKFSELNFVYDYDLVILLIGPKGKINGKMTGLIIKFTLGIDLDLYHASLDSFDLQKGKIDISLSGNVLIDIVINLLTDFVTTILHPLIIAIIEGIVKGVLNNIIDSINSVIDAILHPVVATTVATLLFGK